MTSIVVMGLTYFKDNATLTFAIAKLKADAHLSKRDYSLDMKFQTDPLTSRFATWTHTWTTNQIHVKKYVNSLAIHQRLADSEYHCYRTVTCRKVYILEFLCQHFLPLFPLNQGLPMDYKSDCFMSSLSKFDTCVDVFALLSRLTFH